MALWTKPPETAAGALPYVHDIATASCVFCPYGTSFSVGDRAYIYDEQTGVQRERQVEITAVKVFHSTGRMISLDLAMLSPAEAARIAADSELTLETLLEHRSGSPSFDSTRRAVVVYFKACDKDDATGSRVKHGLLAGTGKSARAEHASGLRSLGARLFSRNK